MLIGPPGAGKSAVGPLLADRLGVEFRDTDADVGAAAGKPVSDIFIENGEETFRELERAAATDALGALRRHGGVLALGSGAVLDAGIQHLLDGLPVVYLSAEFGTVARRIGLDRPRIVVPGNPRGRLRAMLDERARDLPAARRGHGAHRRPGSGRARGRARRQDHEEMTATRIDVTPSDGGRPYQVVVGVGVLGELPGLVPEHARTVVVIHAEGLGEIARPACGALQAAGLNVHAEPVPDGEAAKTVDVAAGLWSRLAKHGVTRSDCVVGLGGGAATDLAAFVAATWLRGVATVLVPTTLLGMADAAVGGKTAIDIPEGKNLVGAFHSPAGVLADLVTLETLPREDYVSGLAEVIKTGFIADPVILDLVKADPEGAAVPHGAHARELIERAIAVKAEVVSKDLDEQGLREILNYGHTLGHAIERVEGYRFRHGDAVAIGMVYVAELARLAGRLDPQVTALHRELLASVGLPTAYPAGVWPSLREAMGVDKKARGARLRLVVLDGLARPSILDDPSEDLLWEAYQEVSK